MNSCRGLTVAKRPFSLTHSAISAVVRGGLLSQSDLSASPIVPPVYQCIWRYEVSCWWTKQSHAAYCRSSSLGSILSVDTRPALAEPLVIVRSAHSIWLTSLISQSVVVGPEDPEDQSTRGPGDPSDQSAFGPVDPSDQRTFGPVNHSDQGTFGPVNQLDPRT